MLVYLYQNDIFGFIPELALANERRSYYYAGVTSRTDYHFYVFIVSFCLSIIMNVKLRSRLGAGGISTINSFEVVSFEQLPMRGRPSKREKAHIEIEKHCLDYV